MNRPSRPGPLSTAGGPAVVGILACGAVAAGLFWLRSSWAAMLLYHLVLAVGLAVRRRPRLEVREILRGFSPAGALLAVSASGLAAAGFHAALRWLDPAGEHLGAFVAERGPSPSTTVAFILYTGSVNPVLEELYWRGTHASRGPATAFDDVLYSLFHVPIYLCFAAPAWALLPVVLLTLAGSAWRLAARSFGGLAVPVLGHSAANFGLLIVAALHLADGS